MPADHERCARRARPQSQPQRTGTARQAERAGRIDQAVARGGGGRKAVLAALEAVLLAEHVPEAQRRAVMPAAADNLAQRVRNGETHRVKVYDRAAPTQRPIATPSPEAQRTRERSAPSR